MKYHVYSYCTVKERDMDSTQSLYSTGEFAHLMKVNKRTLHYYNEIGIFRPCYIDENGYHHYSPLQALDFEMLKTYRKIGMTLEEIRKYVEHPSDERFYQALKESKGRLDEELKKLNAEKALLEKKMSKLELAMKARHGLIEEIDLPRLSIILSERMEGCDWNDLEPVFMDFARKLTESYGTYDNFGSRISIENVRKKDLEHYNAFYAYAAESADDFLEEGHYLRAYSIGSWDKLQEVYDSMLEYAEKKGYTPIGYAYEEGLNEMSLEKSEDYVTMILIQVV